MIYKFLYQQTYSVIRKTPLQSVKSDLPLASLQKLKNGYSNHPDPRRLQVSDKAQFIAPGQHLKKLKLCYTLEFDMVRDWTFDEIVVTPITF